MKQHVSSNVFDAYHLMEKKVGRRREHILIYVTLLPDYIPSLLFIHVAELSSLTKKQNRLKNKYFQTQINYFSLLIDKLINIQGA